MDTLIPDLLDPEEARRPPMALKDYSDEPIRQIEDRVA